MGREIESTATAKPEKESIILKRAHSKQYFYDAPNITHILTQNSKQKPRVGRAFVNSLSIGRDGFSPVLSLAALQIAKGYTL